MHHQCWCSIGYWDEAAHGAPTILAPASSSTLDLCDLWLARSYVSTFRPRRWSMQLWLWLHGPRAKWLRTTWMSSRTSGRSRCAYWPRPWMTSPPWTTSCPCLVGETLVVCLTEICAFAQDADLLKVYGEKPGKRLGFYHLVFSIIIIAQTWCSDHLSPEASILSTSIHCQCSLSLLKRTTSSRMSTNA